MFLFLFVCLPDFVFIAADCFFSFTDRRSCKKGRIFAGVTDFPAALQHKSSPQQR